SDCPNRRSGTKSPVSKGRRTDVWAGALCDHPSAHSRRIHSPLCVQRRETMKLDAVSCAGRVGRPERVGERGSAAPGGPGAALERSLESVPDAGAHLEAADLELRSRGKIDFVGRVPDEEAAADFLGEAIADVGADVAALGRRLALLFDVDRRRL